MSFFDRFATVGDVIKLKKTDTPSHGGLLKVPVNSSFQSLAGYLTDHKIGVAFIYNSSRKIIGLISERDMLRHITLYGEKAFHMPISSMMAKSIECCHMSDKLKQVASRMAEKHIRHMAVVNNENKHVGVISSSDVELFAGEG